MAEADFIRFKATSAAGTVYDLIAVISDRGKAIHTADGEPVNWIAKGVYGIVPADGPEDEIVVQSDDPDAP